MKRRDFIKSTGESRCEEDNENMNGPKRGKGVEMMRSLMPAATILLLAIGAAGQDMDRRVIPIPQQPFAQPVPEFIGVPATRKPIRARSVPQDPFMASNGRSNTHVD